MSKIDEMYRFFGKKHFAVQQGVTIDKADDEGAICSLTLRDTQLNAAGVAQGGIIFTVADFVFAVAANAANPGTVTLNANINYLSPGKGARLVGSATPRKAGGKVSVYDVLICDENDVQVASGTFTGFYRGMPKEKMAGK